MFIVRLDVVEERGQERSVRFAKPDFSRFRSQIIPHAKGYIPCHEVAWARARHVFLDRARTEIK